MSVGAEIEVEVEVEVEVSKLVEGVEEDRVEHCIPGFRQSRIDRFLQALYSQRIC